MSPSEFQEWKAALVVCERHSRHNSTVVQTYVERVRKLEAELREQRSILDELLVYVAGQMALDK